VRREPGHTGPLGAVLLAASPEPTPLEVHHMVSECNQTLGVGRYSVVVVVTANYPSQLYSLLRNGVVHASPQGFLDLVKLGPHSVSPSLPMKQEVATSTATADVSKTKKVERLRFAETASCSVGRRMATEPNQPCLFRMQ